MKYREQKRMPQARSLLIAQSHSLVDIADQLGHQSPYHFSRRFKGQHGITPKHFQEKNHEADFLEQFE